MKYIITLSLLTAMLFGCAVRSSKNHNASQSYGGSFGTSPLEKIQTPTALASQDAETVETPPVPLVHSTPVPSSVPSEQKLQKRKFGIIPQIKKGSSPQDSTTKSVEKLPIEKASKIGFWLAIGGIVASFIPYVQFLSFFALIAALVLGIVGKKNIDANPGKYRGRGMAIAAIVIPIVFIVLALVVLLLLIAVIASGF